MRNSDQQDYGGYGAQEQAASRQCQTNDGRLEKVKQAAYNSRMSRFTSRH